MIFKLFKTISLVVILVMAIAACSTDETNTISQDENDPIAIVNGDEISQSDFERVLERQLLGYEEQGLDIESQDGQDMVDNLKIEILDQLVTEKVLLQGATSEGYEANSSEIEQQLTSIQSQFENEEQFNEALEMNGFTFDELENEIANQITIEKYTNDLIGAIDVSEDSIKEAYEDYQENTEDALEYEEIKSEIEQYLVQEKKQGELSKVVEKLKAESDIEILI